MRSHPSLFGDATYRHGNCIFGMFLSELAAPVRVYFETTTLAKLNREKI